MFSSFKVIENNVTARMEKDKAAILWQNITRTGHKLKKIYI